MMMKINFQKKRILRRVMKGNVNQVQKSILHPLLTHNVVEYCDEKIKDKNLTATQKRRKYRLKKVEVHEQEIYNHVINEASNIGDV